MIELILIVSSTTLASFNTNMPDTYRVIRQIHDDFMTDRKAYRASLSNMQTFDASPAFNEVEEFPKPKQNLIKMIDKKERAMFSSLIFSHIRIKLLCHHSNQFGVLCLARYYTSEEDFIQIPQKMLIKPNPQFEVNFLFAI